MNATYFPETDLEYNVYFNIDRLKRAYVHNLKRIGILSQLEHCRQNAKLICKCKDLSQVLKKLIRRKGIKSIADFSNAYNTLILINRTIDKDIDNKILTESYKKSIGKKAFQSLSYDLATVGNIIYPASEIVVAVQSHIFDFFAISWFATIIILFIMLISGAINGDKTMKAIIPYAIFALTPAIWWNMLENLQRTARLARMGYKCSYRHQYSNKDFLSEAVKSKINRL